MSDRLRRFSRFQIALHWAVGLPYMALLASGALIMLQRAGWLNWTAAALVELLHRWIGIGLVLVLLEAVFAAILTGHFISLARGFVDWMILRPRDIVWLVKAPLNIIAPRWFHLPPVGRYNAGQKLHGVFIALALTVFSATGLLMVIRPADLRPWVIHQWTFYAACGFLALHLFLSLINPVTRRALGGIFTGHVARDYIRDHHSLELDEPVDNLAPHAVVSLKALLLTWAAALVIAGGVTRWYGPERVAERLFALRKEDHPALSPGPLIAAHADDRRITTCSACHEGMQPPTNSACLHCHTQIATVMTRRQGFHGQLQGDCRSCHTDHKGRDADIRGLDASAFNHDLARFALAGKHQSLECDACHLQHSPRSGERRLIGLRFNNCVDCHQDPHDQQFAQSCAACHDEQGWTGRALLFQHDRDSNFKLDATHRTLDCAACHQQERQITRYHGTAQQCDACHTVEAESMAGKIDGRQVLADPHQGRVQCADCHSPEIDHTADAQYADACQRCHTPHYRGLFFDWRRTLDQRAAVAREAVEHSTDPGKAQALQRRLDEALRIGLHNVQQAVRLLEQDSAAR